jgi:hypothetical protein
LLHRSAAQSSRCTEKKREQRSVAPRRGALAQWRGPPPNHNEVFSLSEPAPNHPSPLIVGVSGHRDLHPRSVDRARREVTAFLDELSMLMSHTPVRVMVGMAEGADLLVARAALDRNLGVDAVLPMALDDYAPDFSPEGLRELRALLADPRVTRVVLDPPAELGGVIPREHGDERNLLYVALSSTLVRKSNILVTLWDGEFSELPGGTADTVMRYLGAHSGPQAASSVSFVRDDSVPWDQQIVHWVLVQRAGDAGEETHAAPSYLSGAGEGVLRRHVRLPDQVRQQLRALDHYNEEFSALQAEPYAKPPDTLMSTLPATISARERADLRRIDIEYGKADALAVFCQAHSNRLFRWFSYMACAMGLLFLLYAKLVASKVFLVGYLLVLLAGLGAFHALKSHRWFSKHLAYRALAETMRTQFFLRFTAADRQVSAAELIKLAGIDQFDGFAWITNILKNAEPWNEHEPRVYDQEDAYLSVARSAWIDAQQNYFRRKVAQLEHAHRHLARLKTALICMLIGLTVVLMAAGSMLGDYAFELGFSGKDLLLFVMGLLPVWLGIWELYQGKMATRELLWQYRNQLGHFSRATQELTQAGDRARRVSILAALGKDSLMESYLWTIHRYHREHEPPAAG